MSKLASSFKAQLKEVLEKYIANTQSFNTTEIERILYLPASDVLKKGTLESAMCLQLFQNTVMNGDIAAFQAFTTKNKEVVGLWPFPLSSIETLTRDIAAANRILLCQEAELSMKDLYTLLQPSSSTDASSVADDVIYKYIIEHKVLRRLLFQDNLCKLDEVKRCLTPCAVLTPVKFGGALSEVQSILTNWRDNIDVILKASAN